MTITRYNPNTVFLGGTRTQVNDLAASEAITPGTIVERFNNAGVFRWRKATTVAGSPGLVAVATDQAMLNKGVDDTYGIGDLVEVSILKPGATAWMLLASGQNITQGQKLELNGTPAADAGTLKVYSAGVILFTALESKNATAGQARIRAEAV